MRGRAVPEVVDGGEQCRRRVAGETAPLEPVDHAGGRPGGEPGLLRELAGRERPRQRQQVEAEEEGNLMTALWAYLAANLRLFRREWAKARRHMLEEKQRNMNHWRRRKEVSSGS